jgi:hypothetical protein
MLLSIGDEEHHFTLPLNEIWSINPGGIAVAQYMIGLAVCNDQTGEAGCLLHARGDCLDVLRRVCVEKLVKTDGQLENGE